MKLKQFIKALVCTMAVTMTSSMLLAASAEAAQVMTAEQPAVVEQEEEDMAVDSEDDFDIEMYELSYTEKAEEVIAKGKKINKSVTKNNIIFTFVSAYTDAYSYRIVCSVEKADHSAFADVGSLNLLDLIYTDQEQIDQMQDARNDSEEYKSFEEWFIEAAEENEELKQFIKEDGSIDEEGYASYCLKMQEEMEDDLSMEESGGYGLSYDICELEDSSNKKVYFLLEGSCNEPLPAEAVLYMDKLTMYTTETCSPSVDLAAYLKAHESAEVAMVHNEKKDERLKYMDEADPYYEEDKAYVETMPDYILAEGNLNLQVDSSNPGVVIDNVAFVDNQLHMSLKTDTMEINAHYSLGLQTQNGEPCEIIYANYRGVSNKKETMEESYLVFNIANVEELSKMQLTLDKQEDKIIAEGPWSIAVNNQPVEAAVKKQRNQAINNNGDKMSVKEVEITPLSVKIALDQIQSEQYGDVLDEIVLNMKDGTKVEICYANAYNRKGYEQTSIYVVPDMLINPKDVASITVGNTTIKL